MTQIAIEKRSGFPWWAWLLIAALIITGVIWYFAGTGHSQTAENQSAAESNSGEASRTAAITDLSTVYGASDPQSLVDRQVALNEPVRVLSVTGDQTFWVGPDANHQVLVVLQQKSTPNQPATEGRYDVNPGQFVRVYGTVERFPGYQEARNRWKVSPDVRSELENQTIYVAADRLDIAARP